MKLAAFAGLGGGCATKTGALGLLLLLMTIALASCSEHGASVVEETSSNSAAVTAVGSLTLTPSQATVVVGGTQQFKPEKGGTFAVSDLAIASISAKGLLTAIAPGTVTVTRTSGKFVETAMVTVEEATLLAIDVTCGTATATKGGKVALAVVDLGDLLTCSVMGSYSLPGTKQIQRGTIPNATVTWASTRPTLATVSADGVVQGIALGTAEIVATDPGTGIHGGALVTVDQQPIHALTVTPALASIPVSTEVRFKATARRAKAATKGSTTTPINVIWSVADPTIAAVDATGLVQGLAKGTTTVTAMEPTSGIHAHAELVVTAVTLTSIEIEVAPLTRVIKGVTLVRSLSLPTEIGYDETIALEAIGIYGGTASKTQKLPLAPADVVWSSSNESLATVSSDGVVTCVSLASGSVDITATDTVSGQTATVTFAVSPKALKSIAITSGKTPLTGLPVGIDVPLTLTATFVDGNNKNAAIKIDETMHAAWTSTNAEVAIVSNLAGTIGVLTTEADGRATITATFGGLTATAIVNVFKEWKLLSIDVTPATQMLPNGMTARLVATGVFEEGGAGPKARREARDVTDVVTWSSSSVGVSVSNTPGSEGKITALGAGVATITVEDPGSEITGTATVLVTGAVVKSIAITPPEPTIAVGETAPLEATATLSDGTVRDVTAVVVWTSTDPTVATVSNAANSSGLAKGLKIGTTQIGAADPSSGVAAPDVLLAVKSVVLTKLTISPATVGIADGLTRAFQAIGTYSDGTTKDLTSSVVWSVTSGTATISNAAGSPGLATSHGVGVSTIEAVDASGLHATASLRVRAATLVSIAVTPSFPSVALGVTAQFTATGTYTDGSTENLTDSVAWTISTSAASISNAAASPGLAATLAVGTTVVTATESIAGISGSTTLTVTPATLRSVAVAPLAASVPVGLTEQYAATGTYTDGSTQDITASVTWVSSAPAFFAVSNGSDVGLGTALAVGSATLSATDPATLLSGSATVTVTPAVLQSIAVTPAASNLAVDSTEQLSATGMYSDGSTADLTASATWASSDPTVVSVTNAAVATGTGPGSATVTATDPTTGIAGNAMVTTGTSSCGEGLTPCGSACVDETADPNNCGGCGIQCAGSGATCSAGACAFPVSVTFVMVFVCAEVSFDFNVTDNVDSVEVTDALGTCGGPRPNCDGDCPSCGGTVTFPTPLPAGSPYDVTTTGDPQCGFSPDGGLDASGVVTGPVTLTATCYVNNC